MRTIKKIISNGVDLDTFVQGLAHSVHNPNVMYHDAESEMWSCGSLVKLKVVADLYEECVRRFVKIWGFGSSNVITMIDVYISDDRCMLQLAYRHSLIERVWMNLILLEYNFTRGYAVCDISDEKGIKYCYRVTLLGATKLLTDWCYDHYAVGYRHDLFLSWDKTGQFLLKYADYGKGEEIDDGSVLVSCWESYELDVNDILWGGPVVCDGKVRKVISK